jgi:hypothetical protein
VPSRLGLQHSVVQEPSAQPTEVSVGLAEEPAGVALSAALRPAELPSRALELAFGARALASEAPAQIPVLATQVVASVWFRRVERFLALRVALASWPVASPLEVLPARLQAPEQSVVADRRRGPDSAETR